MASSAVPSPVRATLCCIGAVLLAACARDPEPTPAATRIANPASVNCRAQGGQLSLVRQADGGEIGMCRLPDGRNCEEWALYRKECR